MTLRPRIGISLDTREAQAACVTYELPETYVQAIFAAGGLPVLLPHLHDDEARRELIDGLDGLLIPGGDDIDPALYGRPRHPKSQLMDARRQAFDLAALALAERKNMPTLGICLGFQVMNVQRHGTLLQYLPELNREPAVNHAADPDQLLRYDARHSVLAAPGSRLAALFGTDPIRVNSTHRQGVDKLGTGLVPSGCSADGLVEAIEDPTLAFWMGVQWHPERMPGEPQIKLFSALVQAARRAATG